LVNTQKQLQKLKNQTDSLSAKIEIHSGIKDHHEASDYKNRINDLKDKITKSQDSHSNVESTMNDQNNKWNKIWGQHVEQMKGTVENTHVDRNLKHIGETMDTIKAIEAKTYAI